MKRTLAVAVLLAMMLAMPAAAEKSRVGQVLDVAREQLGKPYSLISDAPDSFNCISFVAYCYNQVQPETILTDGINADYEKIESMDQMEPGDIICFRGNKNQKGLLGYHFGIYVGYNYFIHASSQDGGVMVSRLKNYKKRFLGAIRIF